MKSQLLPRAQGDQPLSRDFYPFCDASDGSKMHSNDDHLLFVSCLQFVELLKLSNEIDPPPSLARGLQYYSHLTVNIEIFLNSQDFDLKFCVF